MRVLFAIQRYHKDVVGGSEAACRGFARLLTSAGHETHVVTSCAVSHHGWENQLAPGLSEDEGVQVTRFPVRRARTEASFGRVHRRLMSGRPLMEWEERLWSRRIGPDLLGYREWLSDHASGFDAAVVVTYMYPTAADALPLLSARVPTAFIPTAHDEPAFRLSMMGPLFRQPHAFGFLTPEEEELVRAKHGVTQPSVVVGVPVEFAGRHVVSEDHHGTKRFGGPYIVSVGRVDVGKGSHDLLAMFREFKRRHPSSLKLVLVGENPSSTDDDVIALGFCSEAEKREVIAGADVLVQPSFMESFSIVLCEAWSQGVPVLVNGLCAVTAGQVARSSGGLAFDSFDSFSVQLTALLGNTEVRRKMGERGRAYVESEYSAPTVTDRLLELLDLARSKWQSGHEAVAR